MTKAQKIKKIYEMLWDLLELYHGNNDTIDRREVIEYAKAINKITINGK